MMTKGEASLLKDLDKEVRHVESRKNYPPHPAMAVQEVMEFLETPGRTTPARRHASKLLARAMNCLTYAVYCDLKVNMKALQFEGR